MRLSRVFSGRSLVATVAMVVGVALVGCGDDGDDGVAADSAQEAAPCNPVGEDLRPTAARTVSVQLQEYSFSPATIELPAGVATFAASNVGTVDHEVAVLPGGGEVPLTNEGKPDEDALGEAGAFELEGFGPGLSCNATFDLKPGIYTLFCIVTDTDGRTHLEKGMRGKLTVV